MSQGSSGFGPDGAAAPVHPLEEMWYLQGETEAQGPYKGYDIKSMVEAGSVGAASLVAPVGATQWIKVAAIPAFASALPLELVRYAGFWIRLTAALADGIVVGLLSLLVGLVAVVIIGAAAIGMKAGVPDSTLGGAIETALDAVVASTGVLGNAAASNIDAQQQALALQLLFGIVRFVVGLFYYTIFVGSPWQATLGKRICGLCVIRAKTGGRVSYLRALGRYLSYALSALPLFVGFILIGVTDQKRGLHDMICGTRVVYRRP
jgi:uncharacterized RDD family membrane protein YckC